MKRINAVVIYLLTAVMSFAVNAETVQNEEGVPITIEVYRSPSCGCCGKWIEHIKKNGFTVKDYVTNDVQAIKEKYGVNSQMASCHTAIVDGYVIEGHVPAADIKKLLKIKPKVVGVSVPGMPVGTPGMDMGGRRDAYNVVSFDKDNNYQVFSRYEGNK